MATSSSDRQLAWLRANQQIKHLQVALCDLNGVLRGKRLPVCEAERALSGELSMPLSLTGVNFWGQSPASSSLVYKCGDPDGLCEWTGRDLLPVNWLDEPSALLQLWLKNKDGTPFQGDPRRALAAVLKLCRQRKLQPVVATEVEFYLVAPSQPRPQPPHAPVSRHLLNSSEYLSLERLDAFDSLFKDIFATCAQQGIPAIGALAENGPGQFEINIRHSKDILKVADDTIHLKRLIKGLARQHKLAATFMAKPYGANSGSSMHLHLSLLDSTGRNIFDDGSNAGAPTLRYAVAGLLATMPETTLLFAPHLNSYRRLRLGDHAPTSMSWGYENRSATLRIPASTGQARRIEHRASGADANPYLVIAAIIAGALEGLRLRREPPEPSNGSDKSAASSDLPANWTEATKAFANGQLMKKTFAPQLRETLIQCKRDEQQQFSEQVTDFEFESYLDTV